MVNELAYTIYQYQHQATLNRLKEQSLEHVGQAARFTADMIKFYKENPDYETLPFKLKLVFAKLTTIFGIESHFMNLYIKYDMAKKLFSLSITEAKTAASVRYNYTLGYAPVLTSDIRKVANDFTKNLLDTLDSSYSNDLKLEILSNRLAMIRSDVCTKYTLEVSKIYKEAFTEAISSQVTPTLFYNLECFENLK